MKLKTLIMMGLAGVSGLVGCTKAQIGKQVIDLDNLDYNLDAAYYYAPAIDESEMDTYLNDTTEREFEVYYRKDTLRYYNTETDKLYPPLVVYRNKGGDIFAEATFCEYEFKSLSMVTTEQGKLVQVEVDRDMDEENFADLLEAAKKKYGDPCFTEEERYGKPVPVYRWETEEEYIQLQSRHSDGKNTLVISRTDDESMPIEMENAQPHLEVTLWRWKKEYHDLTIAESTRFLLEEEEDMISDKYYAESAEFYTPKLVKPFLVTKHYLDSLEQSDVWGKIVASYYWRVPDSHVVDHTGVTDSVKVNQEGCIPVWSFGGRVKNFKGSMSNTEYIVRLMKQGKKLYELMDDAELCEKYYLGEAEWTKKKKFAGVIILHGDEQGNLTTYDDSVLDYYTLYDKALVMTDELKEELKNSGLDLEKTTARSINFPGIGDDVVFFTDGKLEKFMFIGDDSFYSKTKTKNWYNNKIYSVIDYLEEII